jgi:hypothetical protein
MTHFMGLLAVADGYLYDRSQCCGCTDLDRDTPSATAIAVERSMLSQESLVNAVCPAKGIWQAC